MNTLGITTIKWSLLSQAEPVEANKVTYWKTIRKIHSETIYNNIKAYGQLVLLGFDVTTFTPVAYQRHSL